ncbi:MAG: enoyl-CoA hydratase/isomerase family protein, partial [Saprospiraceae bacterium]|nr:enoyl-CoA hydratase/isomerase family protein [Saprospiraceae bacterium]
FQEAFDSVEQMDEYIDHFLNILNGSNPAALKELKKVFWHDTDHWDQLLIDRAQTSGRLVLSTHARDAINGFLNA